MNYASFVKVLIYPLQVPRAALLAGELAGIASFFSFGTNDLTQMVYGVSRDDAESKFLREYLAGGRLQSI